MSQVESNKKHRFGWVKDAMVLVGTMAVVSVGIHFYNAKSEETLNPGEITKLYDTRFDAGRTFAQVSEFLVAETDKKVIFVGNEQVPGLEQTSVFNKDALAAGDVGYTRSGNRTGFRDGEMYLTQGWGGSKVCILSLDRKPASEYAKSPFVTGAKSPWEHIVFWHELGHCVLFASDTEALPAWEINEADVRAISGRILKDPSKFYGLLKKVGYEDFSSFALRYYEEVYADVYSTLAVKKFLNLGDELVYQKLKDYRSNNLYYGERELYLLNHFSVPFLYELRRLINSQQEIEGERIRDKVKYLIDSKPRYLSVDHMVKLFIFTALVTGDLKKSELKDDSWIDGFKLV